VVHAGEVDAPVEVAVERDRVGHTVAVGVEDDLVGDAVAVPVVRDHVDPAVAVPVVGADDVVDLPGLGLLHAHAHLAEGVGVRVGHRSLALSRVSRRRPP
jgi:hypothetical protein